MTTTTLSTTTTSTTTNITTTITTTTTTTTTTSTTTNITTTSTKVEIIILSQLTTHYTRTNSLTHSQVFTRLRYLSTHISPLAYQDGPLDANYAYRILYHDKVQLVDQLNDLLTTLQATIDA